MKITVLIDREALQSRIIKMIADRLGKTCQVSPHSPADLLISNVPEILLAHLESGKPAIQLLLPLADGSEPEPLNRLNGVNNGLHIFAAGTSSFKDDYPGLDRLLDFLLEQVKIRPSSS